MSAHESNLALCKTCWMLHLSFSKNFHFSFRRISDEEGQNGTKCREKETLNKQGINYLIKEIYDICRGINY